jgi:hypothetical protein
VQWPKANHAGHEARLVFQLMLPNPQHEPAAVAQTSRDKPISLFIALNFLAPVSPILFRSTPVFWTAVPETPIHKNCDPIFAKNKIWLSQQRRMTPPTINSMLSENSNEAHLRRLVSF